MRLSVDEYTQCHDHKGAGTICRELNNEEFLLLLADASEAAFSRGYQPLIDLVKTTFAESLLNRGGELQQRMMNASLAVKSAIHAEFPSARDLGEAWYSAVFVAVVVTDFRALAVWIGSPEARLFRQGSCIKKTIPHVTAVPTSAGPGFLVTDKSLSTIPDHSNFQMEIGQPWGLASDDILVLADTRLFALASDDDIANLIAHRRTPAKDLVEWAQSLRSRTPEAALVARVS